MDFQGSHLTDVFWLEYLSMALMMEDASFGSTSRQVHTSATRNGFSENSILKALYALHNSEGRLIVLLYMHVDVLWAAEPEAEPIIEQLLSEFSCGNQACG